MNTETPMPSFPVDDVTLLAVEHAMDSCLTFDRPDDADPDEQGPWRVGGEYGLPELLDFLAGTMGRDESDLPEWERGRDWSAAEIVYDTRPHYTRDCVIRALIAEVRRLREETTDDR